MRRNKYHTVGTIPNSNGKIVEPEDQLDTPNTHIYMTVHFPGMEQGFQ